MGLEVNNFSGGMILSQNKYARDLLSKANMLNGSTVSTPTATKINPFDDDNKPTDPTVYRQQCGSLLYLTLTRPNLTYDVNQVC